jgi:hypothetical protein
MAVAPALVMGGAARSWLGLAPRWTRCSAGSGPGPAGLDGLDARAGPSTAAEPTRTLAAVPSDRGAGAGLDRRWLPDPGGSRRCQDLPDARAVARRGRTPPAPALHRLRPRPPRCWSRPQARCRRIWGGSRRRWPGTPGSVSMTAPVAGGASRLQAPRTAPRSPPTSTGRCSAARFPDPMRWPAIPSPAGRCSPSPLATPTRSPACSIAASPTLQPTFNRGDDESNPRRTNRATKHPLMPPIVRGRPRQHRRAITTTNRIPVVLGVQSAQTCRPHPDRSNIRRHH